MTTTNLITRLNVLFFSILLVGCGPVTAQEIMQITPLADGSSLTAEPQQTPSADSVALVDSYTTLALQFPEESAAAEILAQDIAMKPDIENPLVFDVSPVPITFDEFYDGFNIRKGLMMSEKLRSLDGQEVVMEGYMAPPLKPELDWFVLTQVRLEFCPFCSSDAEWPTDIAVIYLADEMIAASQMPVRVHGRMEIGSAVDPETGMVSLVRIYTDRVSLIQ